MCPAQIPSPAPAHRRLPRVIRIERIDTNHPLYAQECELRDRVLLQPIGLDMDRYRAEFPGSDEKAVHFVAVIDLPTGEPGGEARVVGCVLLRPEVSGPDDSGPNKPGPDKSKPGSGQLVQMAVDPQRQGEGIGRRLVAELESYAFLPPESGGLGLGELSCHARMPAVSFYERCGWEIVGETFQEVGIDHKKLVLTADRPAVAPGLPD